MIKGYPAGSDISVLNTFYLYPRKNESTGKWDNGSLTMIYKDNKTNEKFNQCFENPKYRFYITKEGMTPANREYYISRDKLDEVIVPYKDLNKKIAELTGNEEFYYNNIRNGNRKANNQLHTNARLFNSDMNIEDKYRLEFGHVYPNNPNQNVTKAFFDIEVDGINQMGDFPMPGECPVNAITYISMIDKTIYTFLLRNDKNPLIKQFENSVDEKLTDELKGFIRERVGGWKNEKRYGLDQFKYRILFYEDELQLITDFFAINNYLKPDFLLVWNMRFDIPYLIQRIINLGGNPLDIICHPDFKEKVCRYYIDTGKGKDGKEKDIGKRGDYATIASYSVFIDQMIQYASRRSSANHPMKLDYVGKLVANVNKLDYSHITTKIAELPYKDYKTFVFYNIMDTIVQYVIEHKVNDIEYIYNKCLINNTRYSKCHRQITYLPNRWCKELYTGLNCIMGNNPNSSNPKPDEKYDGAYVADPLHLSDYPKRKINGMAIGICDNAIDFDYKAQYPNEIRENNIAAFTQIGKTKIMEAMCGIENPFNKDKYTREGAFIEDFDTHNWLDFCVRWLHLSSYDKLYDEVIYYFTSVKPSLRIIKPHYNNNLMTVCRYVKEPKLMRVCDRVKNPGLMKVVDRFYPIPEELLKLRENIDIDKVVYRDEIRNGK